MDAQSDRTSFLDLSFPSDGRSTSEADLAASEPLLQWDRVVVSSPERVVSLSSTARDRSIGLSPDGLTIYLAIGSAGVAEGLDLAYAQRPTRTGDFGGAVPFPELNSSANEWSAAFASSGLEVLLARGAKGEHVDLWRAVRAAPDLPFSAPALVDELNGPYDDIWPSLSADGLLLLFVSNRPGGLGKTDVYQAERPSLASPFGAPSPVVSLNTREHEWEATLSADGRALVLASERPGTLGFADLWLAVRSDVTGEFSTLVPLDVLNSAYDEADPVLSADGSEIFFCSNRPGALGEYDIYRAELMYP